MKQDKVVVAIIFSTMRAPTMRVFETMTMANRWIKEIETNTGKKVDDYLLQTVPVETYPELPVE